MTRGGSSFNYRVYAAEILSTISGVNFKLVSDCSIRISLLVCMLCDPFYFQPPCLLPS